MRKRIDAYAIAVSEGLSAQLIDAVSRSIPSVVESRDYTRANHVLANEIGNLSRNR